MLPGREAVSGADGDAALCSDPKLRLPAALCCVLCVLPSSVPRVCPASSRSGAEPQVKKAATEMGPKPFLQEWGPKGSEQHTQPYMGDLALINAWGLQYL